MICNTVLDALGNTPLIRLNRLTGPEDADVLVKFEGLNVGGSIKTRTAFQMLVQGHHHHAGLRQQGTPHAGPSVRRGGPSRPRPQQHR